MLNQERSGLCLFNTPSYPQPLLSCFFPPFLFFCLLVVILELCVCVMSESPLSISSRNSSSSSGASGQTLGQRLTYFIRLSGRRDRSNTTRVDRGGGGWRRRAGPKGLSQSPCSICLPHPSSLHILRRAETASHAETNVKINHYDLSCSALTCSPLVTFPFHSSSQGYIFSQNKKRPLYTLSIALLHFMQKRAAATMSSPSVLSLARNNAAEALWGGLWCVSERAAHANVSFG